MRVLAILSIILKAIYLVVQLTWIWLTLNWNVRKSRKAFEEELVQRGISREDARQLSQQIQIAKDQMMSSIWTIAARARHARPGDFRPR